MSRTRDLIVRAGVAGHHAARALCQRTRGEVDVALVTPADVMT